MAKTSAEIVAKAKAKVPAVTPEEASRMDSVLFVDVREPSEVTVSGKNAGSVSIPRGTLEFKADRSSPYHDQTLGPSKTVVICCAPGAWAAMAAVALKELGCKDVHHMGGFKDWAERGLPVDEG
jgi:rhodanese-related sulfurtransferase